MLGWRPILDCSTVLLSISTLYHITHNQSTKWVDAILHEPNSVIDHLEACFEYGHWLDAIVKPKRLEESLSSPKDYIVVSSPGIVKVRSIYLEIEQHFKSTSLSAGYTKSH